MWWSLLNNHNGKINKVKTEGWLSLHLTPAFHNGVSRWKTNLKSASITYSHLCFYLSRSTPYCSHTLGYTYTCMHTCRRDHASSPYQVTGSFVWNRSKQLRITKHMREKLQKSLARTKEKKLIQLVSLWICVCVCARACSHACVCVCVCACIQHLCVWMSMCVGLLSCVKICVEARDNTGMSSSIASSP